jgi:hypothetical protein
MEPKIKRDADGVSHSKPGTVDQQSEESFPASDPPSFSSGSIGAPEGKTKQPSGESKVVKEAEKKVKSGDAKVPHTY